MKDIRVRYAPSPTGFLHIGGARSALFNYLFARKYGGKFIIRIEDTDVSRNVVGGEDSQLNYLRWLGLDWDESPDKGGPYGPYRQLERLDIYKEYAQKLIDMGLAYYEKKEDSESEESGIRFKVDHSKSFDFPDLFRGDLSFKGENIEDWIIVKDNGIPTYNFAVVIDDHLMQISHVLRGEEHIANTPKQIMIYEAFGWEVPLFGHMTIIVNEERKKLSKRDNSIVQFISEYDQLGYLPEAIFNFICLLGWSPQDNQEIHTKEELINLFDYKKMSISPAMFDKVKLSYINSVYIKKLDPKVYIEKCRKYFIEKNVKIKNEKWLERVCLLFQDRLSMLSDITKVYQEFFTAKFSLSEDLIKEIESETSIKVIETFLQDLTNLKNFNAVAIKEVINVVSKSCQVTGKNLFIPLRICSTQSMHGPNLEKMLEIQGKAKTLKNITKTINIIKGSVK